MIPRRTLLCERSLANLGVYGDIQCHELSIDIFPQDDDVLSLCLSNCWYDLAIKGDPTCLYYVSRAILRLEHLYGRAHRVLGKGQFSMRVAKLMQRMRLEQGDDDRDDDNGEPEASMIEAVFMLDRNVDLVSPLLHQLTYEGSLDESIGISNGYVEVEKSILGMKGRPGLTKVALNSNDALFKEIRDLNFSALGPRLKKKAASVQQTYEERHNAETISEIGQFMKKFKNLQKLHTSLQTHISLAERASATTKSSSFHRLIMCERALLNGYTDDVEDLLEEMIAKRDAVSTVLRLFCLWSLVSNGIKERQFDFFRREIVQSYGYEYMFTLQNLVTAGLLKKRVSRSSWPALKKGFNLVREPDTINLDRPDDLHFAYHVYAPLSIRLVETAFTSVCTLVYPTVICIVVLIICDFQGWKGMEDLMGYLPGNTFDFARKRPNSVPLSSSVSSSGSSPENKRKVVIVVFIGGVTMAEIAALRFLSERNEDREFIVLTTHNTNGSLMMEDLVETLENRLEALGDSDQPST